MGRGSDTLLLLILANSAAWAAGRLLGRRWALPLDLGCTLWDGRRLFGNHKTWRGLIAGVALCASAAHLLGLPWSAGAGFGAMSLLGDALSSAIKRRLALTPGSNVPGLDQLPEALLPLIVYARPLQLGAVQVALVALIFTALNLLVAGWRGAGGRGRQV
jgi:CDP-archaeol synthase